MKVQILDVKQFDPYNKLITIRVREDAGIFHKTEYETFKLVGTTFSSWHYFPSLERAPIDLECEIYELSDQLAISPNKMFQ